MPRALNNILESLPYRDTLWGIGTAERFLASVVPCFNGSDLCPTKLFQLADEGLWKKELAESAERLTYAIKEMHENDVMEKSIRSGADICRDAVMEYDCILSARSRDRDGDLLEQKNGLEIDSAMPLLWQHIRVQPIGKLVKTLSQTEDETRCRFAIIDTELGRDAAKLVAFGALRKSHGFVPKDFVPLETKRLSDGKEIVLGWHVKKSLCVEGSLVSVPSHDKGRIFRVYQKEFDGICTAFSRGELKSPIVSTWAKGFYDARPVVVAGADIKSEDNSASGAGDPTAGDVPDVQDGHSCTCAEHAKKSEQNVMSAVEERFAAMEAKLDAALAGKSLHGSNNQDSKKLPEPAGGEKEDEFMGRCMHDLKGEFPDQKQRTAVCMSQSKKRGKKESGVYLTDDETAIEKAMHHSSGEQKNIPSVAVTDKMMSPGLETSYVPGSWEWIQAYLQKSAASYLALQDVVVPMNANVYLVATFAETAIVCCSAWRYNRGTSQDEHSLTCYEIGWSIDADGDPEWQGEPKEVSLSVTVNAKDLAADMRRVISQAMDGDETALKALKHAREACEFLDEQDSLAPLITN